MKIPKELVVNVINSWLYFQDINQKSKLLEMTRFPQMLLISKGIDVVWQWFLCCYLHDYITALNTSNVMFPQVLLN